MRVSSAVRVSSRWLQAQDRKHFFEVGDIVLFGKYKNKRGKVVGFGKDEKGNPTVEVEPIPKGRKKNKTMGLFRIWHADREKNEPQKEAQIRTADFPSDWDWSSVQRGVEDFNRKYKKVKSWSRLRGQAIVDALRKDRNLIKGIAFGSLADDLESLIRWVREWWPLAASRKKLYAVEEEVLQAFSLIVSALDDGTYLDLVENGRAVANAVNFMDQYRKEVESFVKQATPEHLTYSGFKVWNPQRAPDKILRKMLSGVDHIVAVFRKRGMEKALAKGVKDVLVRVQTSSDGTAVARYHPQGRRIDLTNAILLRGGGRLMDRWTSEVFLHEFGHYVHMSYLHPNAKREWDSGWDPVESARERIDQEFNITGKDRRQFFDLIKRNDWSPSKAARKLKGFDKLRFTAWLRNPGLGEPLITPKQVRLTRRGEKLFGFLRDPKGHWLRDMGTSEDDPELDKDYMDRQIAQKQNRFLNDVLSLDWDGAERIPYALQEAIRKEDKSVDQAIDALETPSGYARNNVLEDFAETFVAFVANPAKLSDQAKFRMQRALSLSGLYGKPVMRLAQRIAQSWLASA